MTTHHAELVLNRRTVLGASIAVAAFTRGSGFGTAAASTRPAIDAQTIDALLLDATIEMPHEIAAFVAARARTLPVVDVHLDAVAHAGLRRVLQESSVILGITSGATLFCVERMAWDHGFRLMQRHDADALRPGDTGSPRQLDAFLTNGALPARAVPTVGRAYRPSRADGTLHLWAMQKRGAPALDARRET